MSTFRVSAITFAASMLICGGALAQSNAEVRRVDRFGNLISAFAYFPASQPIGIDASGYDPGDWIHIFHTGDPNDPLNSIGQITITGVPAGRLNIALAGSTQPIPIMSRNDLLDRSCFNFAGLQFAPGVSPSQVHVFASFSGSTTGGIVCGVAERVEALFDIAGVHAVGGEPNFNPFFNAITNRSADLAIGQAGGTDHEHCMSVLATGGMWHRPKGPSSLPRTTDRKNKIPPNHQILLLRKRTPAQTINVMAVVGEGILDAIRNPALKIERVGKVPPNTSILSTTIGPLYQ